ncbi:hypothetical protein V7S43_009921 [Phytophthora oleae]|uniref:Uncharacterized protein n=1 Tax=Phytophthora oleae TaxID=2107226 RepID=A0ABD3FEX7_9STRA
MMPEENPAEYGHLDSDDDSGDTSVYDDDEELGMPEADPGIEDDDVEQLEQLFDLSLLAEVGGVGQIGRGNVNSNVLAEMKRNGWTTPQTQTPCPYMVELYEDRPDGWIGEDYPGLFNGEHGPTRAAIGAASTPTEAFFLFVTPHLLESIAGASNDYFMVKLDDRIEALVVKQRARKLKKPDFQGKPSELIR